MKFTYGSVCSGIEAVTCAWHNFAQPLWFAEIEPFPSAVLAHHFPEVPNLGDMTLLADKILTREIEAPDVLVGGTPCQAFSVAGYRLSLEDERGNLTLKFLEIANAIDHIRYKDGKAPLIILWENVPGVLSTKDNAFGQFLAGLANGSEPLLPPRQLKWGNAGYIHAQRTLTWRTLDAQYFGVAQRRKRVFLVASARKRSTCQILFEQASLSGNIKPSGKEGKDFTQNIETSITSNNRSVMCIDKQITVNENICSAMVATQYKQPPVIVHGTQDPIVSEKTAHCLGRNNGMENVLFEIKGTEAIRLHENVSPTLKARMGTGGNNVPCITQKSVVRKLTPVECERLQGFPDNWTKIPYRNKPAEQCPDSPRYKAIGNSMAVPVMRWIGLRIQQYLKSEYNL
ncbi:DNA cytosine methyltransferase [Volucribacter amazonae]|uniref:Cytosine-specific methyltransferase n=1 Tax=Volucribacter amazonae TaxID=256731 RepID=A0A9X4PBM2_9PAST|nr:DNA cytosine methyltransferase [Volucribacter amazonae]MDG6894571.1 cytosine methyltransferase [Volucribacter amazonae]